MSLRWYNEETTEPVVEHVLLSWVDGLNEPVANRMPYVTTHLQPMQFSVIVRLCEAREHEVVWVLEVVVHISFVGGVRARRLGGGPRPWRTVANPELDNGRRVDRAPVRRD